jgi:Bacteriophage HK97-gp10, putative tail-component
VTVGVDIDVDIDLAVVEDIIAEAVDDVTTAVEAAARRRCPVDSGALRASIRSQVTIHGNLVIGEVYTDLDYGFYVQQGTGVYGPSGRPIRPVQARVLAWPARGGGMVFARVVRGQRPQPFLTEALAEVLPD